MNSAAKALAILFVVAIVVTNVAGGVAHAGRSVRGAVAASSRKTLAQGPAARSVDHLAQHNAPAEYKVPS
ncbi:hypothetical protein IscW_ISCW019543 [Ixodes scapularis]|uniref:Secreted protein n=1 Tax=Ixodes scapularis TaxID=6945 RepID=B7PWP6_IXOSC|nr:hypothetical protein IscW_ISCW019543 [Ixodes scapularis]|eukprot:XP_002410172.1 hypothetical protein IscW_ISCW019543 [Ixodes scapularis]